jgi:hypothetical protein
MVRTVLVLLSCLLLVGVAAAAPGSHQALDPGSFVARVTNPWFPLKPGTTWVYQGVKDGKPTRDIVTVTTRTRLIGGVRATEVSDRLYERGRLEERTSDWYAQDKQGNVWYLGEATEELDANGRVTSREGSWLTGVGGAKAGVYITGHPRVGQSYRQEYYKGHANDHFQIVSLATPVHVPYISSNTALLTREWTPLEPGVLDHKYYIRGIGTVLETSIKGPREINQLVALHR